MSGKVLLGGQLGFTIKAFQEGGTSYEKSPHYSTLEEDLPHGDLSMGPTALDGSLGKIHLLIGN